MGPVLVTGAFTLGAESGIVLPVRVLWVIWLRCRWAVGGLSVWSWYDLPLVRSQTPSLCLSVSVCLSSPLRTAQISERCIGIVKLRIPRMGKKKGKGGGGVGYGVNKEPAPTSALVHAVPLTLRQQAGRPSGARAPQPLIPSANAASLRADHLLRLATWASAHAAPLGALLGTRLASLCEAAGVPPPDSPHSICERCESIMQVGVNCSVRVTKNRRKGKLRKTENVCNYVTYVCHFCKHRNAKPGTSKSHLKTKISQVAARANLEMLGKSAASETRSTEKKTPVLNLTKSR